MKTQTPVKHYEGGGIRINNSYDAETIEQKINKAMYRDWETIEKKVKRIVENKEPISDGAPIIYTERNKGVHLNTI